MSHRIQLLSTLLANQIAAGEVVERPASVVKELVENALDAEATRIQIDIENGGVRLIQVRDDGVGIAKTDLPLALSRHATSKIQDVQDLQAIATLGFRGEALASICSVSRFTMTSCVRGSQHAYQVVTEGRDLKAHVTPASHPVGTTVTVRDLFFNTPARRKFLRAERTEYQYIEDLVRRIALSRFDVAFILRQQQRVIFNCRPALRAAEQQQRVAHLMGKSFLKNAVEIDQETVENMRIKGWLGLADVARSSVDRQYFYVNGRMVRDRLIQHALRQAYEGVIPEGRHPCYVLYLDLPLQQVDVNVHPTKHEVRFHENRQVHDFIFSAVRKGLGSSDRNDETLFSAEIHETPVAYQVPLRSAALATVATATASPPVSQTPLTGGMVANMTAPKPCKLGVAIGMLGSQLILSKTEQYLMVTHITLAKIYLCYAKLMAALQGESLKSQPLLIPQTIEVMDLDYRDILTVTQRLSKLAIEMDTLGPHTVVIRKLPAILKECRFKDIIRDLIQERDMAQLVKLLSKHIVYAGGSLSKEAMNQLLSALSEIDIDHTALDLPPPVKLYSAKELSASFVD